MQNGAASVPAAVSSPAFDTTKVFGFMFSVSKVLVALLPPKENASCSSCSCTTRIYRSCYVPQLRESGARAAARGSDPPGALAATSLCS